MTLLRKHILFAFLTTPLLLRVLAGADIDLEIEVCTDKPSYQIGEPVVIKTRFHNASSHDIRVFPDPEQFDTRTFSVESLSGTGVVKPLEIGESSTLYGVWARDVATIPAGGTYTWKTHAQLSGTLPADWKDTSQGIYLIFVGGSALQLPGVGQYQLSELYAFKKDHQVVNYIASGIPLFFGELKSKPITFAVKR